MRSIRTRVLAGMLGSMLLILAVGAVLVFVTVRDEAAELFDHQLEHAAYAFAAQPLQAVDVTDDDPDDNPEADIVIQIWSGAGELRFQSRLQPGLQRQAQAGFSDLTVQGERWRAFALRSDGNVVQVAQPLHVRNEVARDTALRALSAFALLVPLAAALIYVTVTRGLRPLQQVTEAVRRRSHRDLAPIQSQRLPQEVAPLVEALNDLMQRLERVITRQKSFVADAAHELLTPMTALQLQAQLLSRAVDEDSRHQSLTELRAGLARTIHLARQLLALARHDPDLEQTPATDVNVVEIGRRVVMAQAPLAEMKSIVLQFDASQPAAVHGVPDALATLLDALVDNAIKYTPAGGRVIVAVRDCGGQPALVVEDSGPGVPPEERVRIFDRFYRRPGTGALGSGLGLSIVSDIAARHRATIQLLSSPRLGGLMVEIVFPA